MKKSLNSWNLVFHIRSLRVGWYSTARIQGFAEVPLDFLPLQQDGGNNSQLCAQPREGEGCGSHPELCSIFGKTYFPISHLLPQRLGLGSTADVKLPLTGGPELP